MIPDLKPTGELYAVKVARRVRGGAVGKVSARQITRWLPTLPPNRVVFLVWLPTINEPCTISIRTSGQGRFGAAEMRR